jgi:hypothetical protein
MREAITRKIFHRQHYHLLVWLILGSLLYFEGRCYVCSISPEVWGMTAPNWLAVSWILAALHQGWVWFFWRQELYRGKISTWFGPAGFLVYRIGFVLLGSVRMLCLIPISIATPNTIWTSRWLSVGLIVITTPFILWGLYSVFVYFGANRAFGADHFDASYRGGKLEKRGIFKYIPNSMYTVVLLALYHPGLLMHSRPGLIAALAHHAFVWTHYFCTEKPDMGEIYGSEPAL